MTVDLHVRDVLRMAQTLGEQGFRVLRVKPNDKAPVGLNWPELATSDVELLTRQFSTSEHNIGVACGPQEGDNHSNMVVIDVDVKWGGMERWAALTAEHGVPDTATHVTPSGGQHVFFDGPDVDYEPTLGGPGIDIRRKGHQVLVPPSWREIDGVRTPYAEQVRYHGLHRYPIAAMPLWVCEMAIRPPVVALERSVSHHPSNGDGVVSNADWFSDHFDFVAELVKAGYTVVGQRGDEVYVRHPTATNDHSATVHLDRNWMHAYSPNMPSALRDAQIARDGNPDWSAFDWWVATEWNGNYAAANAEINRRRGFTTRAASVRAGPTAAPASADATGALFPPLEFYDDRGWMAACRQMAQAAGGSPAAHMVAYVTRWATLIPPGLSIPPINGAPSSFDLLSVIAGTSGSGKTSPMRNAASMLPLSKRKDLRVGLGIGSGEGIIEAFYGMKEVERDGKKSQERHKVFNGVNFAVSEGLIFAELAGRGGTTHVTRLCDAWSGSALSTPNAKADTFRHIPEDQYRLTMVMGIQAQQAHELMTDEAASQGFVGRLLFCWCEEPRVAPRPRPPEPFELPVPSGIQWADVWQPKYVEYPPEVYAEIQAASDARVGTNVPVEAHHHDLLRCKVAGIVALMDGRMFVSMDDWRIATVIVDCSANVRKHLYALRRQSKSDEGHNRATARAEAELIIESVKERQYVARMAEAIRTKLTEGPMSLGKLARAVSSKTTRHRFDAALRLAVSNGWVRVNGQQVEAL